MSIVLAIIIALGILICVGAMWGNHLMKEWPEFFQNECNGDCNQGRNCTCKEKNNGN